MKIKEIKGMRMGRKCKYEEFAKLIKVFKKSHMRKVNIEQRLELGEEVIKAATWLKNYPDKGNRYSPGFHDSISILTNLENCSQKKFQHAFKYTEYVQRNRVEKNAKIE